MSAYVRLIQSRERELGVDVLTHQKWSGAKYVDRILQSQSFFPLLASGGRLIGCGSSGELGELEYEWVWEGLDGAYVLSGTIQGGVPSGFLKTPLSPRCKSTVHLPLHVNLYSPISKPYLSSVIDRQTGID